MIKFFKKNWLYILIFLLISVLSCFFIHSSDDWFWRSSDAIAYLKNGFKYYNGRYISNVIIMLLVRSNFLKCLTYGFVTSLVAYLVNQIIDKKNNILSLLFIILFFLIDNSVFAQGYVWASGFANYFISIIFILWLMKKVCENQFSSIKPVSAFAMGIVSTLFLENVSILLLLINVFLIIYSKIKKVKYYNLWYLFGCLIGTGAIFYNEFFYSLDTSIRQVSFNGMFSVFCNQIVPYYFGKSFIIMFLSVILILFLTFKNRKKLNIIYLISFSLVALIYVILNLFSNITILNAIVLIVYTFYSAFILIKISDSDFKKRIVWYLVLKVLYIAPLVVVSTLGPRLLLFPFIIDIMIIMEIVGLYLKPKLLNVFIISAFILFIVLKIVTYGYEYKKACKLQAEISQKMEANTFNIFISYEEYSPFYYSYLPFQKYFQKYYIEFYNIDTDLKEFNIVLLEKI